MIEEGVLDGCKTYVKRLKDTFHNVLRAKDASKWNREWKAIVSVSHDKKVKPLTLKRFVDLLRWCNSSRGASAAQLVEAM
jgi:hypothetical protein